MRRTSSMDWANSAVAIRIKDGEFYLIGVRNAYTDYILLELAPIDREDMIVPDTRVGYIPFLLDIAKKNAAQSYPADNYSLIEVVNYYERNGNSISIPFRYWGGYSMQAYYWMSTPYFLN